MSIVRKLKSLLGVDDAGDESERDVTVTVEHDPENEAAVKGADVGDASSSGGSHAVAVSDTAESEEEDEDESDEPASADERPNEAADAEAKPSETEDTSEADETDEESTADEVETQDAEEPAADEATGSSEPVDVLNGVGPAYAQRLGDAGVETVGDLANADAAKLSEATEIAEGRIQGWIDQAAEH